MPFNLLLLPLLAGYIFIHNDYYFRLRAQALDGYRLLFEASKFGIFFAAGARTLAWALVQIPLFRQEADWLRGLSPYPYTGTAVIALVMAFVLSPIANLRHSRATAKAKALSRQENVLLNLLNQAAQEGRLVSLTLDTRKWYVGFIVRSPNLDPREQYFAIVPIFSGYRDKDTLEARRETEYIFDDPEADPEPYAKVLSTTRVVDANFFDFDLFEKHYERMPGDRTVKS